MANSKSAKERGLRKAARKISEDDLYNRKMGDNKLQGDDQTSVHNQRQATPDSQQEPKEVMETFAEMDKDARARADLGKGNRAGRNRR